MKRFGFLAALIIGMFTVPPTWGVPPHDFTGDGVVDLADFAVLQYEFNGRSCPSGTYTTDLDGSGCVDLVDFASMVAAFVVGDPCAIVDNCGISASDPALCRWAQFRSHCNDVGLSPVDKRLCRLGVFLDGSIDDGLGAGACVEPPDVCPCDSSVFRGQRGVGFVDNFGSTTVGDPGPTGDGEEPLSPGSPSGFNVGCSVLWFAPDDNPNDGQDTSFLYVAWDLSEGGIGTAPVPYDADGDESPCSSETVSDVDKEFYEVSLQACSNLDTYSSISSDPNLAFSESDIHAEMLLNDPSPLLVGVVPDEDQGSLRTDLLVRLSSVALAQVFGVETAAFPTADAIQSSGMGNPTPTNRRDACVARELDICTGHCSTGKKCSGSGLGCTIDADCSFPQRCVGDACEVNADCPGGACLHSADSNNVEFVVKKIETSGLLGPHTGKVCSGSGKTCRQSLQCPLGQSCVAAAIGADSAKAVENRIAMSQLIAVMRADTDADSGKGSEELASVAQLVTIPAIEVSKTVRCAEEGQSEFTSGPIDVLLGSFVEFKITIENTGNSDLNVTVKDVLDDIGANSLAQCEVACGSCTVSGLPCVSNADCAAGQTCNLGAAPLQAFLTSPQRGLVDEVVNFANAGSFGLSSNFLLASCEAPGAGVSLLESIKNQIAAGAALGTLKGRIPERNKACSRTGTACTTRDDCVQTPLSQTCDAVCSVGDGDTLVLRFKARMGEKNASFCNQHQSSDCENAVTVDGVPVNGAIDCVNDLDCLKLVPAQVCIAGKCGVRDDDGTKDTDAERVAGATCLGSGVACSQDSDCGVVGRCQDGNLTRINILCREITFEKLVGFPGNDQSFVNGEEGLGVPSVALGGFVDIEYVYMLDNVGEITESVAINDPQLCADVNATLSAVPGGISFLSCPLCQPPQGTPVGQVGPVNLTPAQAPLTASCRIRFSKQEALRHFLRRDQRCVGGNNAGQNCLVDTDCPNGTCEDDPVCTDEQPLPTETRDDCYRNCASASADATSLGAICRPPTDRLTEKSFTTICNTQCTVSVTKEVRCLPECDPTQLSPNEGWVSDPTKLKVVPGACVQYRIVATNVNDEDVGICAMKFKDTMRDADIFTSGPTKVKFLGKSCTNVDFLTAFNWDGNDVVCKFNTLLQKDKSVTVLFEAVVGNPVNGRDMPVNEIQVMGAGESDCPAGTAPPVFSCSDKTSVGIDIDRCDLQVRKEVTCDDPTSPNATYEADGFADALPGAKVGFRISVENTGEVPITSLEIVDTMTCNWAVGSITAKIGNTDVSSCVCSGGVCSTLASINGVKDLVPCIAGGLDVGQTLVITYEATVDINFNTPGTPEDCKDTVTVRKGGTDVCSAPDSSPCPERMAMVRVNVEVPDIACDKLVCVDQDNDGLCDPEFDYADLIQVPGNLTEFPATVMWKFQASNPGEVALLNAQICDAILAAHLNAPIPGVSAGVCPLLANGCVNLGPIAPNGGVVMGTCSVRFETSEAWLEFADLDDDGRAFCYSNATSVSGEVDPADLCDRGADPTVDGDDCRARVCMEPPFVPTVSTWGMVILTLSLLALAKVYYGGSRRQTA